MKKRPKLVLKKYFHRIAGSTRCNTDAWSDLNRTITQLPLSGSYAEDHFSYDCFLMC